MNIPVHEDRVSLSFEPPTSKAGEYISLKAEIDLVVAFSACPQVSAPSLCVGRRCVMGVARVMTDDYEIGLMKDRIS